MPARPAPRRRAGFPLTLWLLAPALLAGGCKQEAAVPLPKAGPIVLLTFDSLRADAVSGLGGDPELTPRLAAFAREADWTGTAVAAASDGVSSMASLFTGLQPWQHQAFLPSRTMIPGDVPTLPETLRACGYQTTAFISGDEVTSDNGFRRGFESFQELGRGWDAGEALSSLTGARQFVWIHFNEPSAPYIRRTWLLHHLGQGGLSESELRRLPRAIEDAQLEAYADGVLPLTAADRHLFWTMYQLNVAWADERLNRLLDALRGSGQWNRALIIITANHGEEFGEHGGLQHGGDLGREQLEVPLLVKLPAGWPRHFDLPRGARVAAPRLWATLVESAGAEPPAAVAPSLYGPGPEPLSELYSGNGVNVFSLLSGDVQLFWQARFAPADPFFERARNAVDEDSSDPLPLARARAVLGRLDLAFATTPPVTGGPRRLRLERWARTGTVPLVDPALEEELARRLLTRWLRAAGEERTPAGEARLRLSVPREADATIENPRQGSPWVHSSAVRASGS
jgi:hypothetical protein